jgi:hypothetical protein
LTFATFIYFGDSNKIRIPVIYAFYHPIYYVLECTLL